MHSKEMEFTLQIDDGKTKTWNCKPVYSKEPLNSFSWPYNEDCFACEKTTMSAGTFMRYLCLQAISHSISIIAPPDVAFCFVAQEEDPGAFGRTFIDYIVQMAKNSKNLIS